MLESYRLQRFGDHSDSILLVGRVGEALDRRRLNHLSERKTKELAQVNKRIWADASTRKAERKRRFSLMKGYPQCPYS